MKTNKDMKTLKAQSQDKVNSIYLYRDQDFINKSLSSFGLTSTKELADQFRSIVMRSRRNKNGHNYNYFAQFLTDAQMCIFTAFETELRSMMGCSQHREMISY